MQLIHDPDFIHAVSLAGHGQFQMNMAESYGLGTDDTPIFTNMHEASSLLVGGTLTAVDYVMSGKAFTLYILGADYITDLLVRHLDFAYIMTVQLRSNTFKNHIGARVLYVDTDAHHGDGVQWSFYDDPNVCTLSIHETGRYLFPGTGNLTERGHGKGYGFSFNIPVTLYRR